MYSLTFIDVSTNESKNTYDDWFLIPTSRPVINPPEQKTKLVDIPGGDGHIDMSESLTGYPVYKNRTGDLAFHVLNEYNVEELNNKDCFRVYSEIMNFLRGKTFKLIMEEEPDFYYIGKFNVDKWDSKEDNSEITINYNVSPYKWSVQSTIEDWEWDSFDFENGKITSDVFTDLRIDSSSFKEIIFSKEDTDIAPVCPVFKVSEMTATITMRFVNSNLGIDVTYPLVLGNNQFPDCIVTNNDWKLYLKGTGTISIDYRNGRF